MQQLIAEVLEPFVRLLLAEFPPEELISIWREYAIQKLSLLSREFACDLTEEQLLAIDSLWQLGVTEHAQENLWEEPTAKIKILLKQQGSRLTELDAWALRATASDSFDNGDLRLAKSNQKRALVAEALLSSADAVATFLWDIAEHERKRSRDKARGKTRKSRVDTRRGLHTNLERFSKQTSANGGLATTIAMTFTPFLSGIVQAVAFRRLNEEHGRSPVFLDSLTEVLQELADFAGRERRAKTSQYKIEGGYYFGRGGGAGSQEHPPIPEAATESLEESVAEVPGS